MQAREIIQALKQAIAQVKEQKQEVISVVALERYLDNLESYAEKTGEINKLQLETNLANFRAAHERNLAHYEAVQQRSLEMLRSVLTYGQAALKSSMLINGGAAAALLAFIGNIWQKPLGQKAANSITTAIAYFAFGVLVAAIGTATSYFTQYSYFENWRKPGIIFHTISVLLILGSFALFGLGTYDAYVAFVEHLKP